MTTQQEHTLEELEGKSWDNPTFPPMSFVVTTCHKMRRKPLQQISNKKLRLGIDQEVSLRFPVPIAIERLQANSLASGDCMKGTY